MKDSFTYYAKPHHDPYGESNPLQIAVSNFDELLGTRVEIISRREIIVLNLL